MKKRALSLVLASVLAMSMTGCGGNSQPAATEAKKAEAAPKAEEAKTEAAAEGDHTWFAC